MSLQSSDWIEGEPCSPELGWLAALRSWRRGVGGHHLRSFSGCSWDFLSCRCKPTAPPGAAPWEV